MAVNITACTIARDEADKIGAWVQNAKSYADEIIVVDTGSSDDTSVIAEAEGADVYHFVWQDDFAAAKNHALSKAHGEWISFLDADETFFAPDEVRPALEAVSRMTPGTDALRVTIVNVDEDAGDYELQRFPAVRIFRRDAGLSYQGRVHEALMRGGRPPANVGDSDLTVRHTGYSTKRLRKKLLRDIKLLEEEERSGTKSPLFSRYMAKCCLGLGRYGDALAYAEDAIANEPDTEDGRADLWWTAANAMRHMRDVKVMTNGISDAALMDILNRGIKDCPDAAELYAMRGMEKKAREDYSGAKLDLDRFRILYAGGTVRGASNAHAAAAPAFEAMAWLALKQDISKNRDMAWELLMRSIREDRFRPSALEMAAAFFNGDSERIIDALGEIYKDPEGQRFLIRWADMSGNIELWRRLDAASRGHIAPDDSDKVYDTKYIHDAQAIWDISREGAISYFGRLYASIVAGIISESLGTSDIEGSARLLPPELAAAVSHMAGGSLSPSDWVGWSIGLKIIASFLPERFVTEYASLSSVFSPAERIEAARTLMDIRLWKAALAVLSTIGEDEIPDESAFWHDTGVCLWQVGEGMAAAECFNRAEKAGCDMRDIAFYRKYMSDKMEGVADGQQ